MALFTDGSIATIQSLREYEGSILDVAATESVDLDHKLELAQREIALELTAFLLRKRAPLGPHRELCHVVVTEPLVHWHAVHTLALAYRDAYNSQLNDRYRGKWEEFALLSTQAKRLSLEIGIGVARKPIPKAPAPLLGTFYGGLLPANTYYVKLAWQSQQPHTGAWSDPAALSLFPGTRLTATIPPAQDGVGGAIIYAGASEKALFRQNETPLVAGSTWVQPETGLRTDLAAAAVQQPDYYVAKRQEVFRG